MTTASRLTHQCRLVAERLSETTPYEFVPRGASGDSIGVTLREDIAPISVPVPRGMPLVGWAP